MGGVFCILEGTSDAQRDDEQPVGRHDKDLVNTEAQHQVDEHVEAEVRQGEPEETGATSTPDANRCQEQVPDDPKLKLQ